jgi:predicted nuclease of predicted toxin-antitoxin system
MKFLANENIPLLSVQYLRNLGYDVRYISEYKSGITDRQVLSIAIKEKRTIITFDRDYGELIFKYKMRPEKGIIYLRIDEFSPDTPGIIIDNALKSNKFSLDSKLTVIDKNGIRQRIY